MYKQKKKKILCLLTRRGQQHGKNVRTPAERWKINKLRRRKGQPIPLQHAHLLQNFVIATGNFYATLKGVIK